MKNNSKKEQTIIYLHIPKTGGLTLYSVFDHIYPQDNIYTLFPTKGDKPVKKLRQLPDEEKRHIKVLRGHFGFGRHDLLPQPCTYITMLRDPVERIISHYYYVLQIPEHELHKKVKGTGMGLAEYVRSGISRELNNGQTRAISGLKSDYDYGENPREKLMTAKENLKKYFSVVGLVEKYDESLILLKREFGWDWPVYTKNNVTKKKVARQKIPGSTIEIIKEYNRLDIDLYEYAVKLFAEKVRGRGDGFSEEVEQFKALNKSYEEEVRRQEGKPVRFLGLKRTIKKLGRMLAQRGGSTNP